MLIIRKVTSLRPGQWPLRIRIFSLLRTRCRRMDKIEDVSIEPCTKSKYIQPYRMKYKQDGHQRIWDCMKMHDSRVLRPPPPVLVQLRSISVLIFNKTKKAFVLVRQFRPAVYMSKHRPIWENSDVFTSSLSEKPTTASDTNPDNPPPPKRATTEPSQTPPTEYGPGSLGFTYELCAGLVDKKTFLKQIASEEILEETGYSVPPESIEFVNSYYSSIGTGGTHQSTFYCEVTDEMRVGGGGGNLFEGERIEVVHLPLDEAVEMMFDTNKPKSVGLCFSFMWFENFKRPTLGL